MTLQQAQMDGANTWPKFLWSTLRGMERCRSKLRRHDFAGLRGFTYPKSRGWAGYFSADPWTIYALFTAPEEKPTEKWEEALKIMASVQVRSAESAV
jgi:hypothetical protein